MPPYIEMHREQLILLFMYGGLILLGLSLAVGARSLAIGFKKKAKKGHHEELERFPGGVTEGHGPVPLFLIMLYICLAVWALVYILGHGLGGLDFAG